MKFITHRNKAPKTHPAELLTAEEYDNLAGKAFIDSRDIRGGYGPRYTIKRNFLLSTNKIMALSGFNDLLDTVHYKSLPNGKGISSLAHALTLTAPKEYDSKDPIVVEPFLLADDTIVYEGGQGRHRLLRAFMEGQRTVQVDIIGPKTTAEMPRYEGIATGEHTIVFRGRR
ncbi:hypothetical protein KDA06_03300 [Candidatus Saccharibacteria bacterium]|nr:hypothetical protein [Candidatus Saccharibacteria bacterium]